MSRRSLRGKTTWPDTLRPLGPGFPLITPTYTPRVEAERLLEEYAFPNEASRSTGRNIIIITGPPGSGKTQLILYFVERNRQKFVDAYFIDSSSDELVAHGFKKYIQPSGIADPQEALRYLERSQAPEKGPCLIVFNNLVPSVDLTPYISTSDHFLVLITTQAQQYLAVTPHATVYLGEMTPSEAEELLELQLASTSASKDTLKRIGEALGHHPAALTCATAYINASNTPPDAYLSHLQPELIAESARSGFYHAPTYAALSVSYRAISSRSQKLLLLLSSFFPGGFPFLQLVSHGARTGFDREMYQAIQRSEREIDDAVSLLKQIFYAGGRFDEGGILKDFETLKRFRFTSEVKSGGLVLVSMDEEVKSWAQNRMDESTAEVYRTAFIRLLGCSPWDEDPMDQYLALQILLEFESSFGEFHTNDKATFARVLYRTGDYERSLLLFEQVVNDLQQKCGPYHEDIPVALAWLATAEQANQNYADAKAHRETIRDMMRRYFGPLDPRTVEAEVSLAETCARLGENERARDLYQQALEVMRRSQSEDDPLAIGTSAKLANVYEALGQRDEAVALRRDVYIRRAKVLGKDHVETILAANNLGVAYYNLAMSRRSANRGQGLANGEREIQELLSHAAELQVQVLRYRTTMLGDLDPETHLATKNLMWTSYELGRLAEAEQAARALCNASERLYGPNNSYTWRARLALALFQIDLSSAEAIQQDLTEGDPDYAYATNIVRAIMAKGNKPQPAKSRFHRREFFSVPFLSFEYPKPTPPTTKRPPTEGTKKSSGAISFFKWPKSSAKRDSERHEKSVHVTKDKSKHSNMPKSVTEMPSNEVSDGQMISEEAQNLDQTVTLASYSRSLALEDPDKRGQQQTHICKVYTDVPSESFIHTEQRTKTNQVAISNAGVALESSLPAIQQDADQTQRPTQLHLVRTASTHQPPGSYDSLPNTENVDLYPNKSLAALMDLNRPKDLSDQVHVTDIWDAAHGGFATVYKGHFGGSNVAVKVTRFPAKGNEKW